MIFVAGAWALFTTIAQRFGKAPFGRKALLTVLGANVVLWSYRSGIGFAYVMYNSICFSPLVLAGTLRILFDWPDLAIRAWVPKAITILLIAGMAGTAVGFVRHTWAFKVHRRQGVSLELARSRFRDLVDQLGPGERIAGSQWTGGLYSPVVLDPLANGKWSIALLDPTKLDAASVVTLERRLPMRIRYYLQMQESREPPPQRVGDFALRTNYFNRDLPFFGAPAAISYVPGYQFAVYERAFP
jgi:hypothetical protein